MAGGGTGELGTDRSIELASQNFVGKSSWRVGRNGWGEGEMRMGGGEFGHGFRKFKNSASTMASRSRLIPRWLLYWITMTELATAQPHLAVTPTVARWGHAIRGKLHGFLVIPHALLRYQKRLNITDGEMLVAQNILMHWSVSDPGNLPFIPVKRIAERMGSSARTVQRHIEGLERKGYLYRLRPEATAEGVVRRRLDLTGLVAAVRREAGEVPAEEPSGHRRVDQSGTSDSEFAELNEVSIDLLD